MKQSRQGVKMKKRQIITRRTILGWGWAYCGTVKCDEIAIAHTGTVKQIERKIADDKVYQSIKNGTFHTTQYFVGNRPIAYDNDFGNFLRLPFVKDVDIEFDD